MTCCCGTGRPAAATTRACIAVTCPLMRGAGAGSLAWRVSYAFILIGPMRAVNVLVAADAVPVPARRARVAAAAAIRIRCTGATLAEDADGFTAARRRAR